MKIDRFSSGVSFLCSWLDPGKLCGCLDSIRCISVGLPYRMSWTSGSWNLVTYVWHSPLGSVDSRLCWNVCVTLISLWLGGFGLGCGRTMVCFVVGWVSCRLCGRRVWVNGYGW